MLPALLLTLLTPAAPTGDVLWYPPREVGLLRLRLGVEVSARGQGARRARVGLTVCAAGPAASEVSPIQVDDPEGAWKSRARFSAWSEEQGQVHRCETLVIEQKKPGVVPLPDVHVQARAGTEGWQTVRWTDVLRGPIAVPPLEKLDDLPPSPWPFRLQLLAAVSGLLVALVAALLALRRWRNRPSPPVPLLTRIGWELDRLEADPPDSAPLHDHLADLLRRYLTERFDLPADRRTSAELQEALAGRFAEDHVRTLADLLTRCDRARFANQSAGGVESIRLTREWVELTEEEVVRGLEKDGETASSP